MIGAHPSEGAMAPVTEEWARSTSDTNSCCWWHRQWNLLWVIAFPTTNKAVGMSYNAGDRLMSLVTVQTASAIMWWQNTRPLLVMSTWSCHLRRVMTKWQSNKFWSDVAPPSARSRSRQSPGETGTLSNGHQAVIPADAWRSLLLDAPLPWKRLISAWFMASVNSFNEFVVSNTHFKSYFINLMSRL